MTSVSGLEKTDAPTSITRDEFLTAQGGMNDVSDARRSPSMEPEPSTETPKCSISSRKPNSPSLDLAPLTSPLAMKTGDVLNNRIPTRHAAGGPEEPLTPDGDYRQVWSSTSLGSRGFSTSGEQIGNAKSDGFAGVKRRSMKPVKRPSDMGFRGELPPAYLPEDFHDDSRLKSLKQKWATLNEVSPPNLIVPATQNPHGTAVSHPGPQCDEDSVIQTSPDQLAKSNEFSALSILRDVKSDENLFFGSSVNETDPPSYNNRRSLNLTADTDAVFDNSTLPIPEPEQSMVTLRPTATRRSNLTQGTNEELRHLKVQLDDWRGFLVILSDILLWKKKWHPAALFGGCTLIFFLGWWLKLGLLTAMAVIGILITALDFLVPILGPLTFNQSQWSLDDECRFEAICFQILGLKRAIRYYTVFFTSFRSQMPRSTSIGLAMFFLTSAWIFGKVNSTLILYLLTSGMLLYPGMQKHGVLQAVMDASQRIKLYMVTSTANLPGK